MKYAMEFEENHTIKRARAELPAGLQFENV